MSGSELSADPGTPIPSDNELEQSLRREVVKATKAKADVTVKRIRAASEKRLGIPENFYKTHATWKDKSKTIVEDQVNNEDDIPSSPVLKKSKPSKPTKRKSEEPVEAPKKKRKVSKEESSEELVLEPSGGEEETEAESKPKKATKKTKPPARSKKDAAPKKSAKKSNEDPLETENEDQSKVADGNDSDSDLSVLIDEEPTKKKRGKSKDSQDKPKKAKAKSKTKEDEDPDQAEIKRLQGWLVKCGIRKVWGKELKSYETPKAKIKHLRDMLADAGMTGRYSAEKANQIKEQREMAAEIEAVKEFDETFGAGEEDEPSNTVQPQRKLVRGSKHFDFLSSDGEETD